MTDQQNLKYRIVSTAQKHIVNRVARHLPMTMLETIGRKSGLPRRTPVGGRVIDNECASAAVGAAAPRTCCLTTIRSSGSNSCPAATASGCA
jgi:hypothetical protein